jgi:dihydroneopterin aldolase
VLSNLGVDPDKVRREVVAMLHRAWSQQGRGAGHDAAGSLATGTFRTRVEGLVVRARCGVTDEERAMLQPLRVDLDYLYGAAGEGDDLSGTVDYGRVIEEVARLLEREEFRLLETGVRRVGENVLAGFLTVQQVTVTVTKLKVPTEREVAGVSVEATFYR